MNYGDPNNKDDGNEEESRTLRTLLGDSTPKGELVEEKFFQSMWQQQCNLFRWKDRHSFFISNTTATSTTTGGISSSGSTNDAIECQFSDYWDDDAIKQSPYEELISHGWISLMHLLFEASSSASSITRTTTTGTEKENHNVPLLFKDQASVDAANEYNNNLFEAYLDGCSIVLNHADWICPWIGAVCQDLQKSFPHAYANVYITPPGSQAVRAHADDRDVFILQVVGQKDWKVYSKVPIPFPYPREQVGKDGLDVPTEVLDGPTIVETTLCEGDALYLPRGFVHEAMANENNLSFHVTIALATHELSNLYFGTNTDWTLAGIISTATERLLTQNLEYRKAIDRKVGVRSLRNDEKKKLETQIEEALQQIQQEINIESISSNLETKFHRHNQRAFSVRMKIMHEMRFPQSSPSRDDTTVVGHHAANFITLHTKVRAATNEEKQSVMMDQPRGLRVREVAADAIIQILSALKANTNNKQGIAVKDLKSLLSLDTPNSQQICHLTLLAFAKVCVAQGALAVVP